MANEDDFLDEFGETTEKNGETSGDSAESESNRDLEDMSSEELRQEIRREKKKAARSIVLALSALIAIIAICIAWFVANNVIKGSTSDVSADSDSAFRIASVGKRQDSELGYYWNEKTGTDSGTSAGGITENKNLILDGGEEKTYSKYYDLATHTEKTGEQKYYIGNNNIAWYQDRQEVLEPGASGKLEFYVIPKETGHSSLTVTVKLEGYTLTHANNYKDGDAETTDNSRAIWLEDQRIQRFIDGHILVFRELNDDGYKGWLRPEDVSDYKDNTGICGNTFTISARDVGLETGVFEKDVPYKITLYWVWPKYFRNYIYANRQQNGDLFTDIENNEDYNSLIEFINEQKEMTGNGSKLFFNGEDALDVQQTVTDDRIDSDMSSELLNTCSRYYNLADEYIGNKAKFMYVSAIVE